MAAQSSEEHAFRELQSEQSEPLDVIDQLRTQGLGRLVELPQLIVCGDQSSGKSSVLEAISRVRFPASVRDSQPNLFSEGTLSRA
jgi:GTP1/Obg family GTP-binding protein